MDGRRCRSVQPPALLICSRDDVQSTRGREAHLKHRAPPELPKACKRSSRAFLMGVCFLCLLGTQSRLKTWGAIFLVVHLSSGQTPTAQLPLLNSGAVTLQRC